MQMFVICLFFYRVIVILRGIMHQGHVFRKAMQRYTIRKHFPGAT